MLSPGPLCVRRYSFGSTPLKKKGTRRRGVVQGNAGVAPSLYLPRGTSNRASWNRSWTQNRVFFDWGVNQFRVSLSHTREKLSLLAMLFLLLALLYRQIYRHTPSIYTMYIYVSVYLPFSFQFISFIYAIFYVLIHSFPLSLVPFFSCSSFVY